MSTDSCQTQTYIGPGRRVQCVERLLTGTHHLAGMAPPNYDELSGRELDDAVASFRFGLEKQSRTIHTTSQQDYVYRVVGSNPGATSYLRVKEYSLSSGANRDVEDRLEQRGWTRIVPVERDAPGDVEVVFQHKDGREVSAVGRFKEAVCRASLKAVR
jgi:hypothetical protein